MLEPCSDALFDFDFEKGWLTSGAFHVRDHGSHSIFIWLYGAALMLDSFRVNG